MSIERLVPSTVYERLPSGTRVEEIYSQIVKATGETQVHLAGTLAINQDGELVGEDDMQIQTEQIMDNIGKSLEAAGATPSDVVRIEIYTTDVDRFSAEGMEEVLAFFGPDALPANTLLGVDRLADPAFLVEISATAVIE
ncbi:MAG: RidA family protein [Halobacteriales archaeon]